MNKVLLGMAMLSNAMLFTACTMDDTCDSPYSTLQVDIHTQTTKAPVNQFEKDATIGMFVTAGELGENYDGVSTNSNVKSTFDGSKWNVAPAVYLSNADATIFAYYPYIATTQGEEATPANEATVDGKALPVEHVSQTDYMYGTHSADQKAINNSNEKVKLTMNHALALVHFKINKSNYTGHSVLNKIEILNSPSAGTLDCKTGIITNTEGAYETAFLEFEEGSQVLPKNEEGATPLEFEILVLPVDNSELTNKIQFSFTVDGKVYTYNIKETTKFARGTKNTYNITLVGTELVVDAVVITPWDEETGENEDGTIGGIIK